MSQLISRRVMIFVENLYQELELWYPLLRLKEEGIETKLVGSGSSEMYTGKNGFPVRPEVTASSVGARDFDGVIIPGGFAPDYLRRYPAVIHLIKETYQQGKLIGALCRAPSVLISGDIIRGKRVTGNHSIRDDITNAGAEFVDLPVVVDGNILTAQGPNDLPLFMKEVLSFFWQMKPRLKEYFPDGWVIDAHYDSILLSDLIAGRPVVLFFFDSVFSPTAAQFLPAYHDMKERMTGVGGLFLGISSDSFFSQKDAINHYQLSYPLLSDVSGNLIKAFGVLGKKWLAEWSVFLIDKNGILRYGENCPQGDFGSLPGFKRQLENIIQ